MNISTRRFRVVGVALIVATMIGAAISGCTARRSEQYRQQGDTYLGIDRFADAESQYRRAIEIDPENAEAQLGLARSLLAQQRVDDALKTYADATAIAPKVAAGYTEPVQFLLHARRVQDAEKLAQQFASIDAEEGGVLRAFVARETGKPEDAVTILSELKSKFPKSMTVCVNLAAAYLAQSQPQKAEEELKAALKDVDPNSLAAHMALIDVYHAQNKLPEIIAELEPMVKAQEEKAAAAPNDASVAQVLSDLKLALARALLDSGKVDDAKSLAMPILTEHPDSGWANYIVGSCLLAVGSYAEALPYLQTATHALPQQSTVAQKMAQLQVRERNDAAASSTAAVGEESGGQVVLGKSAKAAPLERAWRELWSIAELQALVDRREEFLARPEPNLIETLSLAALYTNNKPLALELAGRLPADSPLHTYYQVLDAPDFKAMLDFFNTWKETEADREVLRETAHGCALAMHGARMQAFSVYSQCLKAHPDNAVPLYNLSMIYATADMPEFATRCLEKLIVAYPDNMEARRKLFEMMLDSGKRQEARAFAESTYTSYPNDAIALLDLATAYQKTLQPELAIEALTRGLQTHPTDQRFQVRMAAALVQSGKLDAAQALIDKSGTADAPMERVTVRASICALRGDWEGVTRLLTVTKPDERDLSAHLLVAAALEQAKKRSEALQELSSSAQRTTLSQSAAFNVLLRVLGDTHARVPDDANALVSALSDNDALLVQYTTALAYTALQLYPQAYDVLTGVAKEVGASSVLVGLLYDVLARGGDGGDVLAQAKALTASYSNDPAAWLGLAKVCARLKNDAEEKTALDNAVKIAPDNVAILMQQSDYYERQGNAAEAGKVYQHLAQLLPNDPAVSNNLAYNILQTGGDPKKALELAQAAESKIGANPRVLHTLGLAQLRTGNLTEGRKNLVIALEQQPADPTILLDFGQMLAAQGQPKDGKRYAELALLYADQLGLKFDRRAEAVAITGDSMIH